MDIHDKIAQTHDEMTEWRRTLHETPETAFEEVQTSQFVADKLESFGIKVERGLAGTGVVGIVEGKDPGSGAIGLRADMDALDIYEQTNKSYSSKIPGKMHACGHDGHTTMLLGAAKYLAETRDFSGTAYLIFQPAEENEGGARVMVEEGLFGKYPMEQVYGMHNWPGVPVGTIGMRTGPIMASYDIFEIKVTGKGGHGAMPHEGIDPVLITAHIVTNLQTIASRNVDPLESVVVSTTQIHGGDAYNVIPQEVELKGTVRSFIPKVQDMAEANIRRIATSVASAHGAEAEVHYERRYPPTVNEADATAQAEKIANGLVGAENVDTGVAPVMGSEDFAFMLQEKAGSYIWLGAGEESANLHSPHFDFNDEILPIGASYWARLVEETLPAS
ncbi:MAG: amidohydrolase [Alphaproteobacteria bacterium]|nr:amidohydrolase [Alphaproteobacteria bacterium]